MHIQCIDPAALREGDLAAYLDGDAPPYVGVHLADCAACSDELATLQAAAATLQATFGRDACPAPDTLLDYAAGWLPPAQRAAADRHLADCTACQADLRMLKQAQGAESQLRMPAWSLSPGRAPLIAVRQQLPTAQAGMALRGDQNSTLIYETERYHLTLALLREPDQRWMIQGTLIPTSGEELDNDGVTPVYLISHDVIVASDKLDELGFFTLATGADDTYSLHIDTLPQPVIVAELVLNGE